MEKRYQVLAYDLGYAEDVTGAEQHDLGGFDYRLEADRRAQEAVLVNKFGSAQVIRNRTVTVIGIYATEDEF